MKTEQILEDFYVAFVNGDVSRMTAHYHSNAIFEDPAFGKLNYEEVKAMWAMLIDRSRGDLKITFDILSINENLSKVAWEAKYHYGKKRRPVHNKIIASIVIEDDKIIRHTDKFNLWRWSAQAIGPVGSLFGWSPVLKNTIRKKARKALYHYMDPSKH